MEALKNLFSRLLSKETPKCGTCDNPYDPKTGAVVQMKSNGGVLDVAICSDCKKLLDYVHDRLTKERDV